MCLTTRYIQRHHFYAGEHLRAAIFAHDDGALHAERVRLAQIVDARAEAERARRIVMNYDFREATLGGLGGALSASIFDHECDRDHENAERNAASCVAILAMETERHRRCAPPAAPNGGIGGGDNNAGIDENSHLVARRRLVGAHGLMHRATATGRTAELARAASLLEAARALRRAHGPLQHDHDENGGVLGFHRCPVTGQCVPLKRVVAPFRVKRIERQSERFTSCH